MPRIILWIVGMVGAAAAAKWLIGEARRINAELDALRAEHVSEGDVRTLERDPLTGVYRPK